MRGSRRLVWGLAIGLLGCFAQQALGQTVDVFVSPVTQTVGAGDPATVEIRLNTNEQSVCQGGVFLQFDSARLTFVGGTNNTASWNLSFFNVEPAQNEPGIISLNVGASPAINGDNALVSTLNFTSISGGTAALTLLFNAGREETQFWASNCTTALTTNRADGSVTIQGPAVTPTLTATPTPTPLTATVTASPTGTLRPSATPQETCTGDCDGSGDVTINEIIALVNFALTGESDLHACPGVEQWCDGPLVTINCIIAAVNNALTGCPGS